jgi:hypothetical protein
MEIIEIINVLISFIIIVPIFFLIVNYKNVKQMKPILLYLIIGLLVEVFSTITHYVFHFNIKFLGVSFMLFETLFMGYFLSKYLPFLSKIFSSILIFIYFIIYVYYLYTENAALINVLYGGNKFIILIISFNLVLVSFSLNINLWLKLFNYGTLIFALINSVNYSFISFYSQNKQYLYFYLILISISNLIFYVITTLSIIECKKQYTLA